MPFCPNCGKEVSEDIKFCPECGRQFRVGVGTEVLETETYTPETIAGAEDWITNIEDYEALGLAEAPTEAGIKATAQQIKRIHTIAASKKYIDAKGKRKPQYLRLAKKITGKTSAKDMTSQEANQFIEALQQLPSPTVKSATPLRTIAIEATIGAIIFIIPLMASAVVDSYIAGVFTVIWVILFPIFFGINKVLDILRDKRGIELGFKKPTVEEAKFEITYDISHGADTILANYYETGQQQGSDIGLDSKEQERYDLRICEGYWTRTLFRWEYHDDLLSIPRARIIRVVERK